MSRAVAMLGVLGLACTSWAEAPPVWLAVGPAPLLEAIAPLAAFREAEGLRVVTASGPIEEAVAQHKPAFLLLVGDEAPDADGAPWRLCAKRVPYYGWSKNHPSELPSDMAWGDLDGDGLPEAAVGRIPARTAAEAGAAAAKILAFERRAPCIEDLRLVAWAGAPGYGEAIDALFSNLLVNVLQNVAPPWMESWLIASDRAHVLCGWPPDQPALFAAAMREGSLLNVFMGHGITGGFRSMRHEGQLVKFTLADAAPVLGQGPPAAPLVLYTCASGAFNGERRCIAEELLFLEGGPAAVIAATVDSHPIPNHFSGVSLLELLGRPGEKRLGALWLAAQRLAQDAHDPLMDYFISIAKRPEAKMDVPRLKRDQFLMYAIFGDPALNLKLPDPLLMTREQDPEGCAWQVSKPEGAARLEIGLRPPAAVFEPAKAGASRQQAHAALEEANARGAFAPQTVLDAEAPWHSRTDRPGRWRFVVTGPGVFCVDAVDIQGEDNP